MNPPSVPYVQVGKAGEVGDIPVLMSGYGGFVVPLLPYYDEAFGKLWLERGGAVVIANIRGGGEFGAAWHQAGHREGKKLSHDDFAAIAADLVKRGVAHPERIAAEGGSNGGLLVSNMLTRYPERFGAIFCTIPMVDMRRFIKMGGGAWVNEYGDPDNSEDRRFLSSVSAYHIAAPGKRYPPILTGTNRSDDRVHCGHRRKLAAKLQAMGYVETYYYEPATGGTPTVRTVRRLRPSWRWAYASCVMPLGGNRSLLEKRSAQHRAEQYRICSAVN